MFYKMLGLQCPCFSQGPCSQSRRCYVSTGLTGLLAGCLAATRCSAARPNAPETHIYGICNTHVEHETRG